MIEFVLVKIATRPGAMCGLIPETSNELSSVDESDADAGSPANFSSGLHGAELELYQRVLR
jgi:hypothetical protein